MAMLSAVCINSGMLRADAQKAPPMSAARLINETTGWCRWSISWSTLLGQAQSRGNIDDDGCAPLYEILWKAKVVYAKALQVVSQLFHMMFFVENVDAERRAHYHALCAGWRTATARHAVAVETERGGVTERGRRRVRAGSR